MDVIVLDKGREWWLTAVLELDLCLQLWSSKERGREQDSNSKVNYIPEKDCVIWSSEVHSKQKERIARWPQVLKGLHLQFDFSVKSSLKTGQKKKLVLKRICVISLKCYWGSKDVLLWCSSIPDSRPTNDWIWDLMMTKMKTQWGRQVCWSKQHSVYPRANS